MELITEFEQRTALFIKPKACALNALKAPGPGKNQNNPWTLPPRLRHRVPEVRTNFLDLWLLHLVAECVFGQGALTGEMNGENCLISGP